jgi:hypothetical protein
MLIRLPTSREGRAGRGAKGRESLGQLSFVRVWMASDDVGKGRTSWGSRRFLYRHLEGRNSSFGTRWSGTGNSSFETRWSGMRGLQGKACLGGGGDRNSRLRRRRMRSWMRGCSVPVLKHLQAAAQLIDKHLEVVHRVQQHLDCLLLRKVKGTLG